MADETGAPVSSGSAAGSSPAPSTTGSFTPAVSTPASATPTPAGTTTPVQDPQGPIPFDRHKEILESTRGKTRTEVETEYRQKYGWADEYQRDPWTFMQQRLDAMANHPQYAPHVLSYYARALQARRGLNGPRAGTGQAQVEEPKPDVPIVDAQGQVTGYTYSDKALKAMRQYDRAQLDSQVAQKLQPLEQLAQQWQQAQQQAQVDRQASQTLTELRQQPHFTEHEAAIKQALIDHEDWGDNVHRAYLHVLQTKVLPTLSQTEQAKVLTSLQTQANGGSVNPGQRAPSQTPKFKSFSDAAEYYAAHPDEAAAMAKL